MGFIHSINTLFIELLLGVEHFDETSGYEGSWDYSSKVEKLQFILS